MNAAPAAPPPPPQWRPPDASASRVPESPKSSDRLAHPIALFAVVAFVGLAAGLALGIGVGYAAGSSAASNCSPSDGWCDLGAAITGLFFGGIAGIVTYVIAGVTVVTKCRPSGRRAGYVVAHLAFPFVAMALLAALQFISELAM